MTNTNRRSFLLAVLGVPLLSPVRVKKVVADLAEQTLTTTWVAPSGESITMTRERSEKNQPVSLMQLGIWK